MFFSRLWVTAVMLKSSEIRRVRKEGRYLKHEVDSRACHREFENISPGSRLEPARMALQVLRKIP